MNATQERRSNQEHNLGRLARTPQSALETSLESGSPSLGIPPNHYKRLAHVSMLFGLLAIIVVLGFVFIYFQKESARRSAAVSQFNPSLVTKSVTSETQDPAPPLQTLGKEAALKLVLAALENTDPLLFSKYFIFPRELEPARGITRLQEIQSADGKIDNLDWVGTKFIHGLGTEEVVVYMTHSGRTVNRIAQVIPQTDGTWRIDFDSYTRASSPNWYKILSGKGGEATVRIFIDADSYYNGPFSDDSKWKCYAIASPDVDALMYAYTKIGSPQELAIQRLLSQEEPVHRALLKIKSHDNSASRQFEITRVLSDNWVLGDRLFDENL
ncbi:MAG: hypothetical protein H7Y36_11290 [Armatimonadetes bacterium]|nr:hypothetical protein [Akkermansiaceae bacterium]